jgi:Skp family chaperone for outer membrane proteins
VLGTVAEVAKVAGEESAPALTQTLLDAVFSDAVRERLVREAEAGLRDLIDASLQSMPASASYGRLQREVDQAERQLREMLHEAIDGIFAGPARAEFQGHLEDAAREVAAGNTDAARDEAREALQSLLSEILKVLQIHWGETLRLLLGIGAKALEASFVSHISDAFGSITTRSAEELEEKVEPFQEKIAARAKELQERLMETRDTMQERLAEAKEQVQGRLGQGMSGGANGSQRHSTFGAPPSRRPPPGPARNRPPGRAPNGRPPSISR